MNFRQSLRIVALSAGLIIIPGVYAVTCTDVNISPSNPDSVYIDSNDGTITDTRTNLMWKKCAEGQAYSGGTCTGTASTYTWQQALTLAKNSGFASYVDWRLPNIKELFSLVEECRVNTTINEAIFPATPNYFFWSSSPFTGSQNSSWNVIFSVGTASYHARTYADHVRLVRGGSSASSFDSLADTTAPNLSSVGVSSTTATATTLSATADESATGYWIVVARNATAPTAAQVKSAAIYSGVTIAAADNAAMTANIAKTFSVAGLTAATDYDLYLAAEDGSGNLTTSATKVQFTTQNTASAPALAFLTWLDAAARGVNLSTRSDQNAIAYYVVLPAGAAAPTAQQIADGKDAAGGAVALSGSTTLQANQTTTVNVTGLSPLAAYDIYLVAADVSANPSASQSLRVTTTSTLPPLNDTRAVLNQVRFISNQDALSNPETESVNELAAYPGQDARFGRDAAAAMGQLTKVGAGIAGFDYSKIANNGSVLSASVALGSGSADWACTRDNVTGLMWEVKSGDGGLRDKRWTYSWYISNPQINGGEPGTESGGICKSAGRCDTEKYVSDVNAVGLCGYRDWRLPSVPELLTLANFALYKVQSHAMDMNYFPDAFFPQSNLWNEEMSYMTATSFAKNRKLYWTIYFGQILVAQRDKSTSNAAIRLVRGGN